MDSSCLYQVMEVLSRENARVPALECYFFDRGRALGGFVHGEEGGLVKCGYQFESIEDCLNEIYDELTVRAN